MNLTESQLLELKKIELDMLDELVRICDKYHIRYFLSGGSCLGAVRHSGFIPWDDDIDVGMLREDYNKFAELCKTELNRQYVFQDMNSEPNCGLVFGKIRKKNTIYSEEYSAHIHMSQGVWIDIFPYDKIPNEPDKRTRLIRKVNLFKNIYIIKCGYYFPNNRPAIQKIIYYLAKIICMFMPLSWLIGKLKKTMVSYQNDETCKYAIPFGGAYKPEIEIEQLTMLTDLSPIAFEGKTYYSFTDYDGYLKKHYGNYMELPPVEKRHAGVHHMKELKL